MTNPELIEALRGLTIAAENLIEADNSGASEVEMEDYRSALGTAAEHARAVLLSIDDDDAP